MLDIPRSFFEEETRDGYLVSEMMKRSWAAQLSILDSLKKLFEKYGLQYFVCYGSLIGAVRHSGYIPWDDDLDIVMPRRDFMILLDHADEIGDGLTIRSLYNSETYMNFSAVATHKADVLQWDGERTKKYYECPFICYVDIFPWDYVPKDAEALRNQKLLFVLAYKQLYDLRFIEKTLNGDKLLSLNDIRELQFEKDDSVKEFLSNFEKLNGLWTKHFRDEFYVDPKVKLRQQLCIAADKAAQICDEKDADYVEYFPFFANKESFKPQIKKEWIKNTVTMPFEFGSVKVPEGYKNILELVYGKDYITPRFFTATHEYPFFRNEVRVLIGGDVGEMLPDVPQHEPSVEGIPIEIRQILMNSDGNLKKIKLYGLSATDVINRGKKGIGEIIDYLEAENKPDTVLFTFVAPGLKDFMAKCNLDMYPDYCTLIDRIGKMDNVILDDNPATEMLWALIFICDGYYGDECRLAEICKKYDVQVTESSVIFH